jgi:hypothetical protein
MKKEWKVDGHRIYYNDEKEVLYLVLGPDEFGVNSHREYTRIAHEVFKGRTGNRHSIIDLSTSSLGQMSKKYRDELAEEIKTNPIPVDKTALVGASPIARMFAKVIARLSLSSNTSTRFVKNEEEAMEWFNT